MKNSQNVAWIVGALFVSVLLAVVVYFFAISPQLDAAADARDRTAAAKNFNDQLDIQILGLKKKEQEVPMWRGEMAAIAVDLPPNVDQSKLDRFLVETLQTNKVPVINIEYGTPTVVDPASATEQPDQGGLAPDPAETPEPTATPDPAASPEPSQSPSEQPVSPPADGSGGTASETSFTGLLALPVTLTTEGDPTAIMRTLRAISTTDERFLTITNVQIARADITEDLPGRPALTEDDWEVTVTFQAFVLYQDGVTLVPEEPGSNPSYTGGSISNPFKPLPGTEQKKDS